MENTRPRWTNQGITEQQARWFYDNRVKQIRWRMEMTSADTNEHYIDLYIDDPNHPERDFSTPKLVVGKTLKANYNQTFPRFVTFKPSCRGLLDLEASVENDIRRQDDWDDAHQRDLDEYQRLKEKLGR